MLYNDTLWDAILHDERDKQWSDIHQQHQAKDQTSWFLRIVSHRTNMSKFNQN